MKTVIDAFKEKFPYLDPSMAEVIEADAITRGDLIYEQKWFNYPLANRIIRDLEHLLKVPRCSRPQCRLIVGNTNNGKSRILERFESLHPAVNGPNGVRWPVLLIQAPPKPTLLELCGSILTKLGSPCPHEPYAARMARTLKLLKSSEVRILMIDEVQHVLSGSPRQQQAMLNGLKYLSNELKISIVVAGTREAYQVIAKDPQLQNRFQPKVLTRWGNNEAFLRLLDSFESTLPLREASGLSADPKMVDLIYGLTEGYIGEVATLLNFAAFYALMNGQERIDMNAIVRTGHRAPSDRAQLPNDYQ